MGDEHFANIHENLMTNSPVWNARKHLLKSGLKLSPTLAPKVFRVVNACRENLGLTSEMEIYVEPDQSFNAACYPPVQGKLLISFTSGLLERFDEKELAFVLGHEIGHALFNHSSIPVRWLLDSGADFSPLQVMRMFAWKRAAEISADRIGLLASRDFEAAGRAFFKLSSGVSDNSFETKISEYIEQFSALQEEMKGSEVSPEDWYSTHPFSPLRLKGLELFNKSQTYFSLIDQEEKGDLTEAQLEYEIKTLLSLMDPSYLQDDSAQGRQMTNFVFYGGFAIAASNGVIDASELNALGQLLTPEVMAEKIPELQSSTPAKNKERLEQIAEDLNVMLPTVSKLNLIKDLTLIASADGSIEDIELQCLYWICSILQIRGEFVDHVIQDSLRDGA